MNFRKAIAFALSLCILFASAFGGATYAVAVERPQEASSHHGHHGQEGGCAEAPLSHDAQASAEAEGCCPSMAHSCCLGVAPVLPAQVPAFAFEGGGEPIAFSPPPRLTSRAEDIYKPPRLSS